MKINKILSVIVSFAVSALCAASVSSAAYADEEMVGGEKNKNSSSMTWYIDAASGTPGEDIQLDIRASNPVALKSIKGIGIKVASPIQITGMSEVCNNYNAPITSSISGDTISFEMESVNPSAGNSGDVLFSVYCHIPEDCANGIYPVQWNSSYLESIDVSGKSCTPMLIFGRITVSGSGTVTPPQSTTTTTTTSTTTTTTTTTTTSTSTSSTTTTSTSSTTTTTTTTTTTSSAPTDTTTTTTTSTTTTTTVPSDDLGDVNDDGTVDSRDASMVLSEYARLSTGGSQSFSQEQWDRANVNGDNAIDSRDASLILSYYAYTATGGKISFADFMKL